MRATKLIRGLSGLPYEERLRVLQLPTLRYRQLRGYMIQLYKYVNNKYDTNFSLQMQYKFMLEKRYDTGVMDTNWYPSYINIISVNIFL